MSPACGEVIARKSSPKIHYGHDRPVVGLLYFAPPALKIVVDQADGSDEQYASRSEGSELAKPFASFFRRHQRWKTAARVCITL
jgi:hypothetical protein